MEISRNCIFQRKSSLFTHKRFICSQGECKDCRLDGEVILLSYFLFPSRLFVWWIGSRKTRTQNVERTFFTESHSICFANAREAVKDLCKWDILFCKIIEKATSLHNSIRWENRQSRDFSQRMTSAFCDDNLCSANMQIFSQFSNRENVKTNLTENFTPRDAKTIYLTS